MSKRMKVVLLCICFSMILSAGVVAANYDVFQKYVEKDEVAMQSEIKALSQEQLIYEIDILAQTLEGSNDINSLIPFVSELFQRKDTISDQDIMEIIQDSTKAITTREAMVDLYLVKHENKPTQGEIKALLLDQKLDKAVKARIVGSMSFSESDISLLKELIAEDDGLLAFHSLKALRKIDHKVAYDLAKEILADVHSASKDELSAALRSTANYLNNIKSNDQAYLELEKDFINLSLDLILTNDDIYVQDSAFFAISEIGSKESISRILESDFIDRELKVFAVDQNFVTLKEMLSNEPTEADIKNVVVAMELLPIVDLADALEGASQYIQDINLKQQADAVLKVMKESGVKANEKWLDN